MAYWEWGDADNPRVLVCVHGLSRNGRDFDVLAQALSEHYRVICPDVVGRGQSDWLADCKLYQIPTYVADMMALLEHLRAPRVDWVGTSMGGLIGMVLGALPHAPIARLVLNDVGPVLETEALVRISGYVGQMAEWPTLAAAAESFKATLPGFGPHSQAQWLALHRHMLRWTGTHYQPHYDPGIGEAFRVAYSPQNVSAAATAAAEAFLWQSYDALTCPTLLLRGQDSDLLSAQTAKAMRLRGPRPRLCEFAGVGHVPTLIQPDQLAVVQEFLRP
jgi:pimeloyl-ACP methyl ester carboxylesterase